MPSFYQDRLGTNIGKTQKETVFLGEQTASFLSLQFCFVPSLSWQIIVLFFIHTYMYMKTC